MPSPRRLGHHAAATDHIASARASVRAALADSIAMIVDRDQFTQRLAQLIAATTGHERVALYARGPVGGDLALRHSTLQEQDIAPARIPAASVQGDVTELAATPAHRALVVPVWHAGQVLAALVLFSESGRFSDYERDLAVVIADAIAPAVAAAEEFHAVKQSSVLDLATGAYAGWYLAQRLEEEIARAQRSGRTATVVLVSVFDFERVHDALPFEQVDALLRELAGELAGATRAFDVVARRGPGEFAILLPDSDLNGAGVVIDRIRARVARVNERLGRREGDGASSVPLRLTTGLASYPTDGDRVTSLLLVAEHRLNEDELQQRRGGSDA